MTVAASAARLLGAEHVGGSFIRSARVLGVALTRTTAAMLGARRSFILAELIAAAPAAG